MGKHSEGSTRPRTKRCTPRCPLQGCSPTEGYSQQATLSDPQLGSASAAESGLAQGHMLPGATLSQWLSEVGRERHDHSCPMCTTLLGNVHPGVPHRVCQDFVGSTLWFAWSLHPILLSLPSFYRYHRICTWISVLAAASREYSLQHIGRPEVSFLCWPGED